MKERFKMSILITVALVIASLVCTESALAKKVRVDSIPHKGGRCYQFIAEDQPPGCTDAKSSIWLVETVGGAKCDVKVWAAYGDNTLTCKNVKKGSNLISKKNLFDLKVKAADDKILSNAITADTECDHVWLRFIDPITKCNSRCYIIRGRVYCR